MVNYSYHHRLTFGDHKNFEFVTPRGREKYPVIFFVDGERTGAAPRGNIGNDPEYRRGAFMDDRQLSHATGRENIFQAMVECNPVTAFSDGKFPDDTAGNRIHYHQPFITPGK